MNKINNDIVHEIMKKTRSTYWQVVWKQFCRHRLGVAALIVVFCFVVIGIYAPLLASSKPLFVQFEGKWYFPLFRYLFYPHFFSKPLDLFYNLLMFTFPLFLVAWFGLRRYSYSHYRSWTLLGIGALQCILFLFLVFNPMTDPAFNIKKTARSSDMLSWKEELEGMNDYAKLNLVLRFQQYQLQQKNLQVYQKGYEEQAKQKQQTNVFFPTLWNLTYEREKRDEENLRQKLTSPPTNPSQTALEKYHREKERLQYLEERRLWLENQIGQLHHEIMPLLRPFHWEDDAGGDRGLNRLVSWWDLTRINRKDMVASLIFGIRISLSVGLLAIGLALLIGIPVGAIAGYYGGKLDLIVYRLIEIWESMPTFFMLLMIVAFLQSKSIFLIIGVIGFFGWTSFSRFIRGEFFRQKQLLYVEACHALGYSDKRIIFSHLLPNAIPPLLTLIPFAIMGAITSEAALSFLGLGEEGSNSWGVLMDEGRSAFPSESYLLWPPAILLTILLISIALIGDTLRDALDPKLHSV